MSEEKVDLFLMMNAKYFPTKSIISVRNVLLKVNDRKFAVVLTANFKRAGVVFFWSFFLGRLGIDRFMIGHIGLGILKLLTGGFGGIMWLIDLFIICKKTKQANLKKFVKYIREY